MCASMKYGWMPFARRRFRCSMKKDGVASMTISDHAWQTAGFSNCVPRTSSAVRSSVMFIWFELIAIVTWSGFGVSSASRWRVS